MRIVSVLKDNDEWKEVEFKDLKKNDRFTLVDDGVPYVSDSGEKEYVCLCDAYQPIKGQWMVEIAQPQEE